MTKKQPKRRLTVSTNTMTIEQALQDLLHTKNELISTQRTVITEQKMIMMIYEERHQVFYNLYKAIEDQYPKIWETLEDLRAQLQYEAATELADTLKVNKDQYPEIWEAINKAVIPKS